MPTGCGVNLSFLLSPLGVKAGDIDSAGTAHRAICISNNYSMRPVHHTSKCVSASGSYRRASVKHIGKWRRTRPGFRGLKE